MIALYQFQKPVSTPETYADIFQEMTKLGAIDVDFAKRLIEMAKFRNRLVHIYWDLDKETIYKFIQEDLEDFALFKQKMVEFLNNNPVD